MDLKRVLDIVEEEVVDGDEEELASPDAKRRRTLLNSSSMQEAIGAQYMQKHLPKLEPFLRRVVQEEVHNVLIRHIDSAHRLPLQLKTSSKRYKLQFQGNLPQTLFTGNRVEAENKQPLRIVLTDAVNNQLITSGPLSSMKVELLVLDGDFNADERLEHTEKEFSESIVFEREGKRPLLSGEVVIVLEKGVGSVRDISFTDNSSWIRSRKFRLGARMSRASSIEERVQEAVSNPFLVKDHRGEVYKKHHPPALADDVWRLEKIGKDGVFHKKLADFGIHTVQDFLRNLVMDQYGLRGLLGSGMSNKMWESTVEHARECVLDDKLYSYCSGHGIILLFNCIHEIIGVVVGSNCFSVNALTATQKALVVKLQQDAYKFPGRIVEFKVQSQSADQSPTAPAPPGPASAQMPGIPPQGGQSSPTRRGEPTATGPWPAAPPRCRPGPGGCSAPAPPPPPP
ncbi:calmodulin-binding protein 60 D-like isoform X3 [Triticum dicoccoides]|uniref:calmodulin-binding protein 60 D-like isoform X3 n=1 Tax=Triticum dicoccoides TaxID=85692 RepID=UPI00188EF02D|nr:calmodulin-binding protein 60 D-like isoform X3 [Triticum dicoccoides]XP_044363242.1 calmodulin-binding protein 60 D-like isoform X3 [Triticum aestivum]